MAAILLAPIRYASTALAGDTSTSGPLAHLLIDHLGAIWRSTATAPAVTLALGSTPIDSVVLWGTNLAGGDTVRIRIGPNASGASAVYDQTFTAATNILAFLGSPITASYLRLDFTRSSGASGTEVARLIVGDRLEFDGLSKDAEVSYDDQSPTSRGPGWFSADDYSVLQTWRFTVEGLTEDDWFAANGWHDFINTVGEKRPFVFLPYYPATYASKVASYGAMISPPRQKWITMTDRAVDLAFQTVS